MKSTPCLLVVLALASCAVPQSHSASTSQSEPARAATNVPPALQASAPKQADVTNEEAARNRARPYLDGVAALELFRASTDCENLHSHDVLDRIAKLREDVSLFHSVRSFPQYEQEARDRHTELSFAFADEALRHGCLDTADAVYRDVFTFYVGATYAGIRDRAKLGIEDVRARRSVTAGASK